MQSSTTLLHMSLHVQLKAPGLEDKSKYKPNEILKNNFRPFPFSFFTKFKTDISQTATVSRFYLPLRYYQVWDRSWLGPYPRATPLHSLTPSSSPKAESYSWLFLKEAFEAMSQFFPFLSLGIVYFGHLLFSMSCECHCEAGLSWTASTREPGRSKAGPAVKNTSRFISPLKTKPWGPFATAEPGNGAS